MTIAMLAFLAIRFLSSQLSSSAAHKTFDPHPNPPPEYKGRGKFFAASDTHPSRAGRACHGCIWGLPGK
jgi:hypothetical protein